MNVDKFDAKARRSQRLAKICIEGLFSEREPSRLNIPNRKVQKDGGRKIAFRLWYLITFR